LHFDIRHAVFREDALLLGDEQRRGVGQRNEAQLGGLHFRTRGLRERARWKIQLGGSKQCGRAAGRLQELAAAKSTA
jgi:hypothetical protein